MTRNPGRYAFDTNMVVALLRRDRDVVTRWRTLREPLLPAPVLGELLYGAARSSHPVENRERVSDLMKSMAFVPCDEAVCAEYGRLKAALAAAGRPIPENDLWVAACCVAANAVLVTRDLKHFGHVPGLICEQW